MPCKLNYNEGAEDFGLQRVVGLTPESQSLSESDIAKIGQRLFEASFAVWYAQHRPASITETLNTARRTQGPLSVVRLPAEENMNSAPNDGTAVVEEEYLGFGVNGLDRSQLDSVAVARGTTLNRLFTEAAENSEASPSRANQRGVFVSIPLGDVTYRVHGVSRSSTDFQEGWDVSGGFAVIPLQTTGGRDGVSMIEGKLDSLS